MNKLLTSLLLSVADVYKRQRYVRVTAEGAGVCPADHVRPGQEARVYFDEIRIE